MACNPTWQHKDLAQALNLDPSMVTRLLSPLKCIEGVAGALKEEKVGISDCYAASKLPPEEQAGLLSLKLAVPAATPSSRRGVRNASAARRR